MNFSVGDKVLVTDFLGDKTEGEIGCVDKNWLGMPTYFVRFADKDGLFEVSSKDLEAK